jgi:hypothetical protein
MRNRPQTKAPGDLPASFELVFAAFGGDKQVYCGREVQF